MPRQEVNVFSRRQPLGISRQQSGLAGRTTYGARMRTGVQAAAFGRGPAPAPAPAPAPENALAIGPGYGSELSPNTAPRVTEQQTMTPAEWAGFKAATYGGTPPSTYSRNPGQTIQGYPTKLAAVRVPGAINALQQGMKVAPVLMRTVASPLTAFYTIYGGIRGAQAQRGMLDQEALDRHPASPEMTIGPEMGSVHEAQAESQGPAPGAGYQGGQGAGPGEAGGYNVSDPDQFGGMSVSFGQHEGESSDVGEGGNGLGHGGGGGLGGGEDGEGDVGSGDAGGFGDGNEGYGGGEGGAQGDSEGYF